MFTYAYSQPDDYHFSLDSIHFAEWVATQLKSRTDLSTLRVLDLCAGCGVIGLELSFYVRELRQMDFVEVQDSYTDFFKRNVKTVNRPELQLRWHVLNYESLLDETWKQKIDLIVCNPPYFQRDHGMLSPSEFKNRCRFYLDSSFEKLILAMVNVLSKKGRAYFLLRPLNQHGFDAFSHVQKILAGTGVTAKKVGNIRGTDVVLMEKNEHF
ncbi:MAG TPA: methyltransferase [Gammaproteobacteria bacterium]|nr:methyltransferase [Gammaproteobacteria bacterium]